MVDLDSVRGPRSGISQQEPRNGAQYTVLVQQRGGCEAFEPHLIGSSGVTRLLLTKNRIPPATARRA